MHSKRPLGLRRASRTAQEVDDKVRRQSSGELEAKAHEEPELERWVRQGRTRAIRGEPEVEERVVDVDDVEVERRAVVEDLAAAAAGEGHGVRVGGEARLQVGARGGRERRPLRARPAAIKGGRTKTCAYDSANRVHTEMRKTPRIPPTALRNATEVSKRGVRSPSPRVLLVAAERSVSVRRTLGRSPASDVGSLLNGPVVDDRSKGNPFASEVATVNPAYERASWPQDATSAMINPLLGLTPATIAASSAQAAASAACMQSAR
jgi:hypothetical protein